jgi:pimeloyl-ACP methyl ester carboxylesterase
MNPIYWALVLHGSERPTYRGRMLAYDRAGAGVGVLLLHGWPGDRTDYRRVASLVSGAADAIAVDLAGFGESVSGSDGILGAAAQAGKVIEVIERLGLQRPIVAGYDVGSRVAQTLALVRPDLVRALVLSPPLPGVGDRILSAAAQREFWYQAFHQLPLAGSLVDGDPVAVREYLRHFWSHWSGPDFVLSDDQLDHLVSHYARPGAFTASIGWYRAGAGAVALSQAERAPDPADRVTTPTTVLWPLHDPLFPVAWSDRLGEFFADVRMVHLPDAGHFTPVEAPEAFAAAIVAELGRP